MSTEALGKRPTRVYNSGVEEAKRLRGTSDLSWWYEEENEDADKFESELFRLDDDTKRKVEGVFGLLDTNGDCCLSVEDFMWHDEAARKAHHQWEELRAEFTVGQEIHPLQFVQGLKRLAMKQPVDQTRVSAASMQTHLKFFLTLNDSANNSVRKLCSKLLDSMVIMSDETKGALERAWGACNLDGDDKITLADFGGRPAEGGGVAFPNQQYQAFCTTLWQHLDLDGDGSITKLEFVEGIKRGVIATMDRITKGSFHSEMKLAQFNEQVNIGMVKWCSEATMVVAHVRGSAV